MNSNLLEWKGNFKIGGGVTWNDKDVEIASNDVWQKDRVCSNFLETVEAFDRPVRLDVEVKAHRKECFCINMFATSGQLLSGYSFQPGAWGNKARLISNNEFDTNQEIHMDDVTAWRQYTVRIDEDSVGYFIDGKHLQTHPQTQLLRGPVRIIPGMTTISISSLKFSKIMVNIPKMVLCGTRSGEEYRRFVSGGHVVWNDNDFCVKNCNIWTDEQQRNWVRSADLIRRPCEISAEIKASRPECVQMSLFNPGLGKLGGYALESGAWQTSVICRSNGNQSGQTVVQLGDVTEWSTFRIRATADGKILYYINSDLVATHNDAALTQGHLFFTAGMADAWIRSINIIEIGPASPSSAPLGTLAPQLLQICPSCGIPAPKFCGQCGSSFNLHGIEASEVKDPEKASSDANGHQASCIEEIRDVFLSHDWGTDELGRSNHERVKIINRMLQERGITTWFDEQGDMKGNIMQAMTHGIDNCKIVAVHITKNYLTKVDKLGNDNCKFEFMYALRRKQVNRLLPVVMEPTMLNQASWFGQAGGPLCMQLYHACVVDGDELKQAIDRLADMIKKTLAGRELSH
jgi:hypothetical protein